MTIMMIDTGIVHHKLRMKKASSDKRDSGIIYDSRITLGGDPFNIFNEPEDAARTAIYFMRSSNLLITTHFRTIQSDLVGYLSLFRPSLNDENLDVSSLLPKIAISTDLSFCTSLLDYACPGEVLIQETCRPSLKCRHISRSIPGKNKSKNFYLLEWKER